MSMCDTVYKAGDRVTYKSGKWSGAVRFYVDGSLMSVMKDDGKPILVSDKSVYRECA